MPEWTLYIDKCKDNSLYTGISNNPDKRLIEHNLGQGAQWFKQHGPGQIVYTEKYQTYLEAHRRELQIKKWSRKKKDNLIKYGHPTKIVYKNREDPSLNLNNKNMKLKILLTCVLLNLFLLPAAFAQLTTSIEISPTEITNYYCPAELVSCAIGTVPQSYIGDNGCTKWKCVPKAEQCPFEIADCPLGTVPQSYIGDNGCTKWKCVPKAEIKEYPTIGCMRVGDIETCSAEGIKPIEAKISSESGIKTVSVEKIPAGLSIKSEKATAITTEKLVIEGNKLSLKTLTGNKEIKILPEEASAKATTVTEVNTIELKEESQQPIYSVMGTKQVKLFYLIPLSMSIETKVNAELGNVISVKKPWWSFFAR